jgi:hypothetical protein
MELCVSATELVSRWGMDGRTKRLFLGESVLGFL